MLLMTGFLGVCVGGIVFRTADWFHHPVLLSAGSLISLQTCLRAAKPHSALTHNYSSTDWFSFVSMGFLVNLYNHKNKGLPF